MKKVFKAIIGSVVLFAATFSIDSCTDPIKFGNEFLEKAPGGTVTADTVFSNAEYTRQFLAAIYSTQYYALPTNSTNSPPQCRNYWKGMPDALSDCFNLFFTNTIVGNMYYSGALTSSTDGNNNGNIYPFLNEKIWENVRNCYNLIERLSGEDGGVPGLPADEAVRMVDEAKCLLASQYFITFRHYGGLPIVKGTFQGNETEYNYPRASVEETVNFIVGLLDEVITNNKLPWGYTGTEAATQTGRWTLAGAMALKIKVLQHAASPLFNDNKPYFDGAYTMEDSSPVWYGNFDQQRWVRFRTACEDFLKKLDANGIYSMVQPTDDTQVAYRFAFRASYLLQNSPEIIMSTRVAKTANGNDYGWWNLRTNARFSYCPTQEYVEMFPWADGTPFDWDETEAGKGPNGYGLDQMFVTGDKVTGQQMLQNRKYTRDPRLYETAGVNGALQNINWGDGRTSGANYELWVGGTDAGQEPINQTSHFSTGYRFLKYYSGAAFQRKFPQWVWLSLAEVYLSYAEALCQTGELAKAIQYVDMIRARVGLGGLVACNPDKDFTKKEVVLEEILRERACEFAFNEVRYFDMIRYKREDLFERPLHRLLIYRLDQNGNRTETQWYKTSFGKNLPETDPNFYEPTHFDYEKQPITVASRYWWTNGFEPKWYLQPFPIKEINKGYGLVQNPGW